MVKHHRPLSRVRLNAAVDQGIFIVNGLVPCEHLARATCVRKSLRRNRLDPNVHWGAAHATAVRRSHNVLLCWPADDSRAASDGTRSTVQSEALRQLWAHMAMGRRGIWSSSVLDIHCRDAGLVSVDVR